MIHSVDPMHLSISSSGSNLAAIFGAAEAMLAGFLFFSDAISECLTIGCCSVPASRAFLQDLRQQREELVAWRSGPSRESLW